MTDTNIFEFMTLVGKLKETKRTGWVLKGIENPECVAGHMYRMSIMTMLIDKPSDINKDRCMKLALVHDLSECIVGDLTPHCGVSVEEKHKREREAMQHLCNLIPKNTADEIMDLYTEYETQSTGDAKLVKELDRYDMILQAFEYEMKTEKPSSMQDFFDSTQGKFHNVCVKTWVEDLYERRQQFVVKCKC